MQRILRNLVHLTLALCIVFVVAQFAEACPTCKDGLAENDPQQAAVARGYFYSILFMMAMPFVILGTFGSFAYLSIRKAKAVGVGQAVPDGAVFSGTA